MRKFFPLALLFTSIVSFAQFGANDPTFNTFDDGTFGDGSGFDDRVYSTEIQSDGKIIVGGDFSSFNGTAINSIARLNVDGSLDPNFNPGTALNNGVLATAILPDGRIMIGGQFTLYNIHVRNRIAILNPNGTLDMTFNPGAGFNDRVTSIAIQPDGKFIVGGWFTSFNGTTVNRIVRLNANGSLDGSFIIGTGFNGIVWSTTLQPDGKILVGGDFTDFNGSQKNRIARLNPDGSLDTVFFNPGAGFNSEVYSTAIQSDGKIVAGGTFTSYNGTSRNRVVRLNSDGSLDSGFNPGTGFNNWVSSTTLQPDGKIIVGGTFTSFNNTGRNRIARLNINGSLDANFNPGNGFDNTVSPVAIQPNGKIIVGGNFTKFDGVERNSIVKLNADGSINTDFAPNSGFNNTVRTTAIQPDGKIIAGGFFTSFNGKPINRIARLTEDGEIDTSFNPGTGFNSFVHYILLQPDGKILVAGDFTSFNDTPVNYIARLHSDGSLDSSFNIGAGLDNTVRSIALQNDGKIIVGGWFNSFDGTPRNLIARLNADGSLDGSFNPGTGFNIFVWSTTLQPDGKILVCGAFTVFNGTPINRIARLNSDGSLDAGFDPGSGFNMFTFSSTLQPDGKIVVGGDFTYFNGTPVVGITRLHANGSIDTDFNVGSGFDRAVLFTKLQSNGKILAGGRFSSYNGIPINGVASINTDGTLDADFDPGTGIQFPSTAYSIDILPNKKIIVGGDFNSYDGIHRHRMARLVGPMLSVVENSASSQFSLYPNPTSGQFHIVKDGNMSNTTVTVRNYLGQEIFRQSYTSTNQIDLTLEGRAAGLYFVEIVENNNKTVFKVVKN
ncbi:MAG: T9SS C-terminal target domain-containing protein [Flavobacteriales bacterium]|nr:MAG: T9SS C-terminal target domain-containing protein [Flavobacteriales bacterium]